MELKLERLTNSLINIRDAKQFTQSYLAQRIGISQKAYSHLESGRCKLSLLRFLKITEITETHPMEIINNVIPQKTSWNTKIICFNQKDCQLQKAFEELKEENRLLRASLDRLLSSDK